MTAFYLVILIAVQMVCAVAIIFLLRRPSAPRRDPQLDQIQEQLTRMDARGQAAEDHVRGAFEAMRREAAAEAQRAREASENAFRELRGEVTGSVAQLGKLLQDSLREFRGDNKTSDSQLREAVEQQLRTMTQRISEFARDAGQQQTNLRETLNNKLKDLMESNTVHQNQLRSAVEQRLTKLNEDNARELEKMRRTVDEKLNETLHSRLNESFSRVQDQLNKVHTGFGEMNKLSAGVSDLNRIFTNVKSRGGFAEVQLGMLLEQILAPGQFKRNAHVKEGSREVVEFAVRIPGPSGEMLLPIDAKFPREDWERLEAARESNQPEDEAAAGKAFEAAIRAEGDRISAKYINEPVTTQYAIMFLPTEGLYAEVMRRDALQREIRSRYHVTIAGPSTLYAILTSFKMGLSMLAIQEKGNEVWNILKGTKKEFGKFGELMEKMEDQVGTVQSTMQKLSIRTRAINRTLREVDQPGLPARQIDLLDAEETPPLALAAEAEEAED